MTGIRGRPPPTTGSAAPAILLPVTVCFARLFAAVFELPFQRHRGWIALQQAMSAWLWELRRTGPAVVAGRWRGR